jgi:hypothetical protein
MAAGHRGPLLHTRIDVPERLNRALNGYLIPIEGKGHALGKAEAEARRNSPAKRSGRGTRGRRWRIASTAPPNLRAECSAARHTPLLAYPHGIPTGYAAG